MESTISGMMQLDRFGRSYLRLTLEINKHIEGYVDAYFGPPALQAEVEAAPPQPPATLLDEVARARDAIPHQDPARQAYLVAILRALEGTIRLLNEETFDYLDEVQQLYDVCPQMADESVFQKVHKELDGLLPGQGPVAQRLEARRQRYQVSQDRLLPLLELVRVETQRRTAALVDLPEDENIEIQLTADQPWNAYNWYLGNGRSLIEFNTDIPKSALKLISTMAHEGYPGHHTELSLKEARLYREKGYGEQAVMLLHSPVAVIAEGIATTAVEIIFPDDSHHQWNIDVLLPAAQLTTEAESATQMRHLAKAARTLRYVTGNAAILYHTNQLNREQTIDYIQTYALSTPERAQKSFSFLSHPLFRCYVFTYTQGYDLIAQAAENGDKRKIFRRLLTEQILPSQLASRQVNSAAKGD
jgi:hypothetical protein